MTDPTPPPQRPAMGMPATLPIPGNAEFALYLVIVVVFAIIWAASDAFDVSGFVTATTVLTAAYFISRGIAKASRVYEQ
ncbi:MAG: hypothetical protein ICV67_07565 [Thermoleophilia bacterium]|nr:hypothetical protein [Thermoleophilia bacterium]